MKIASVFTLLVLITLAIGKPTSDDDYDPNFGDDDPDMQKDDYNDDYDADDSNDENGDEDFTVPVIVSKPDTFVVKPHESILLPCNVEGNIDTYVTMWKKRGQIIFQDTILLVNKPNKYQLKNTSLLIENVDQNDEGEYTCEIPMTTNSPRVTHHLYIETPVSILGVNAERNLMEYKAGDTLVLMCNASGIPEPKITWSLRGNRLDASGKTLMIENIRSDNSGMYQCLAENGVGDPAHQSIHIKVNHKPIVNIEKITSFIDGGERYAVELRCIVHSVPNSIVTWRKDGEVISNEYKTRRKNDIHTLSIPEVKNTDLGKFSCIAENQVGKTEHHYNLVNVPSQPVYELGEQTKDGKEVTMTWKVESLYPISEHKLLYKKKTDTEWSEELPEVTNGESFTYTIKHTMRNLQSGDYEVKVKSKNKAGWSEESKMTSFTVTHKPHHGNKKHHHTSFNEASEHNIQTAPEIAQTRSEETQTGAGATLVPTSLVCLVALTLLNRH